MALKRFILLSALVFAACSDNVASGASEDVGITPLGKWQVAGLSQKGPFVTGSTVNVFELEGSTLNQTGKIFKSTSGWASPKLSNRDAVDESGDGTDAVGFTALPAGYRDYNGGFGDDGYETTFWSSTDGSEDVANFLRLDYYDREAVWATNYVVEKRLAYSVRCLKD